MERLRRRIRKDSPSRPTVVNEDSKIDSGKTTPEPGVQQPPLQVPHVPNKKPSPFRNLHFSRSHKRARSPPPASLPQSPTAAVHPTPDRPASSPTSVRKLSTLGADDGIQQQDQQQDGSAGNNGNAAGVRPPKIPSFLTLSPQEIESKFVDITWMERERIVSAEGNPSPDHKWARVRGEHLKRLDRYMNIQPWHNNRVKLKVPAGRIDYINASPIALRTTNAVTGNGTGSAGQEQDRYIAMQGPKHKTTDHVWRMVAEQLDSPAVIVMLTETHEAHLEKCYPYFPRSPDDPALEVGRKDEFGDGFRASVRCEAIEETPAGDAIELRKLVVRVRKGHKVGSDQPRNSMGNTSRPESPPPNKVEENGDIKMFSPIKSSTEEEIAVQENEGVADVDQEEQLQNLDCEYEERVVWHFLYKKWPDFGVPALEDLESFFTLMRLSREKNASPGNPRVVHCSAGVGRSGTFIALEHLIRELDDGALEHWDTADLSGERRGSCSSTAGNFNGKPEGAGVELEGKDLIFNTVNQLREQRKTMVQAESQFLFIYQVMRKLWQDKYGVASDVGDERAAKRLEFDPFVEE